MRKFMMKKPIILLLILIFTAKISFIIGYFINKPVEFAIFHDNHAAQTYFDKHYPIGSDVNILLNAFTNSGATCSPKTDNHNQEKLHYHKGYECAYFADLKASKPLLHYKFTILANEEDRIIKRYVQWHNDLN